MKFERLRAMRNVSVCCWLTAAVAFAQQGAPGQQQRQSPFEPVPVPAESAPPSPAKPAPGQQPPSPFEAPKPVEEAPAPKAVENVIEAIEFRGARRVPADTLRARIFSKRGDVLDEEALRRDFMALWNMGRFDDIRLEIEPGKTGQIVRFILTERQMVRTIR
jgi:outer membrane protein insertion porin family